MLHVLLSGKAIQNHNVPCAVCQAERNNVLMIPAKNTLSWLAQGVQWIPGGRTSWHKNNRVSECLDHDPEADQAGYRDENGALMYQTGGVCGSLPCPPYEQGRALTCVICTK